MILKGIYKKIIWTELFLFIAGAIGDANAIPYLRHGATLGPILFLLGIIIWIPLRLKNPIPHPFRPKEYKSSLDAVLAFMFNNFVLEFWAFCFGFGMLIILGGGSLMKSSIGFQTAITKIQQDEELKKRIGEYRNIGNLISGSTSSREADLVFSAYGTNGGARVRISITKESNEWQVNFIEYK
jgi:hypothetical protein